MTARLRVHLPTIAANIAQVQRIVAPARVMFVVKDDAYGHGIVATVKTAAAAGIEWFGAFDVRTGREVRSALGGDVRIFVWIAGSPDDIETAIDADLDLGVGDGDLLEEVAQTATLAEAVVRVHLKIDSGLHRNGVRPEQWASFVRRAAQLHAAGVIEVAGVWSHIAEASDAEDDAARAVFDEALAIVRAEGLDPGVTHLAASAAAFARPEFRYDLVRVGAFCYGIRSAGGPHESTWGLRPAAAWQADVLRVEDDHAVIGIGALDGVPSTLAGRIAVGTRDGAMPLVSVEETESRVRWPAGRADDTVVVYGPGDQGEGTPTDLAEAIGTIGEEIALRVAPHVRRVYDEV